MIYMDNLLKKANTGEILLSVLFVIYIIMDYKIPPFMASTINTTLGNIIILFIFLSLFYFSHPLVAILGLFVVYTILKNVNQNNYSYDIQNYLPSENKKYSQLNAFNQFPYSLEEEIVNKMTLFNINNASLSSQSSYKPTLVNTHDASSLI